MTTADDTATAPVLKSVTVNASAPLAFQVFTEEFDTWWPRTHHIGKAPMKKAVIEGRQGGRCYTEQTDGTDCDWGTVLIWDPPHRFVMAWQINADWTYQPDLEQSSEVDVRFTPQADGSTRVDLEHRRLERHGAGAAAMRTAIDAQNGWSGILQLFLEAVGRREGGSDERTRRGGLDDVSIVDISSAE